MKCNMQLVRKSCWKSCRQRSRGLFCVLTFRNQRSSFTAERALIKHWWKDMASICSSRDTISLRGCVPLRRTLQYEFKSWIMWPLQDTLSLPFTFQLLHLVYFVAALKRGFWSVVPSSSSSSLGWDMACHLQINNGKFQIGILSKKHWAVVTSKKKNCVFRQVGFGPEESPASSQCLLLELPQSRDFHLSSYASKRQLHTHSTPPCVSSILPSPSCNSPPLSFDNHHAPATAASTE
jgi:hypothetical protein